MANVSIIDIKVQAEEWEKFRKSFSEFNKQAQDSFKKIGEENKKNSKEMSNFSKLFKSVGALTDNAGKGFEKIGKSLREASRSVLSITGSLLKWGALLAVGGGLSMFGMAGAIKQRAEFGRNAALTGTNSATQRYMSILAGSGTGLLTTDMLAQAHIAAGDRSKWSALAGIGMTDFNKYGKEGSAQFLAEALPRLLSAYREHGGLNGPARAGAAALGVPEQYLLMGRQDQARMLAQANQAAKIEAAHPVGGQGNNLAFAASELQQQFKDLSAKIGNLVLPTLIKFGTAINKALGGFLSDPDIKKDIGQAQKYISSKEFQSDLKGFIKDSASVAKTLVQATEWIASKLHLASPVTRGTQTLNGDWKGVINQAFPTWKNILPGSESSQLRNYFSEAQLDITQNQAAAFKANASELLSNNVTSTELVKEMIGKPLSKEIAVAFQDAASKAGYTNIQIHQISGSGDWEVNRTVMPTSSSGVKAR